MTGAYAWEVVDFRIETSFFAIVSFASLVLLGLIIKKNRDNFAMRILILIALYSLGRCLNGALYMHGTFCSSAVYPWNEWSHWIIAGDVALALGQVCG